MKRDCTSSQLYRLDHAGLGGQCIVPSTVNLGLTLHTGWTCQLTSDVMVKTPLQSSMTSLLSKQLAKFRTRLAAANRANLSVHAKIIYFNTFSLSLFYYSQTHRFFSPVLLKPLYHAMADFLLKRHWFPQHLLVGLCRWLRIGPLLDPTIMQAISICGRDTDPWQRSTKVLMLRKSNSAGGIGKRNSLLKTFSVS